MNRSFLTAAMLVLIACSPLATAADSEAQGLAQRAVAAAGGPGRLLTLFRMKEKYNFGEQLASQQTERESVVEPPKYWWLGTKERQEEPAKWVVWAWTLGILTAADAKLETLPAVEEAGMKAAGLRVSGAVNPPLDLYFETASQRLLRVDWRADIYRFSDWRDYDGTRYPAKTVIHKKSTGKPWFFHEVTAVERLRELPPGVARGNEPATLVEARKIWDQAPHNAFTDLVRYQNRWFCVFREGKGHVSPDGALRVITSTDGQSWESAALLTSPNSDLRDAKINVTPDGQLMLCGAEALHDKSQHTHQSVVWFSRDGKTWSEKHPVGDPDFWLWRVTWHQGKAYGLGYGCRDDRHVKLYASADGRKFDALVPKLFSEGYPNESSMVFEGDTAYCLLRRDAGTKTGQWGISRPPYTAWEWKDLGVRIGGPHQIRLADGRYIAVVRYYDGGARTSVAAIDPQAGKIRELLKLPSGGDTSYAGIVEHEGLLWISYYSSHEGKTSIYLAKVRLAAGS